MSDENEGALLVVSNEPVEKSMLRPYFYMMHLCRSISSALGLGGSVIYRQCGVDNLTSSHKSCRTAQIDLYIFITPVLSRSLSLVFYGLLKEDLSQK